MLVNEDIIAVGRYHLLKASLLFVLFYQCIKKEITRCYENIFVREQLDCMMIIIVTVKRQVIVAVITTMRTFYRAVALDLGVDPSKSIGHPMSSRVDTCDVIRDRSRPTSVWKTGLDQVKLFLVNSFEHFVTRCLIDVSNVHWLPVLQHRAPFQMPRHYPPIYRFQQHMYDYRPKCLL